MTGTMQIFRWQGIPVKLHWTLPLFLMVRIFSSNDPILFRYNLAFAALLIISVLVHEYGHALTAKRLGGRAHEIVLWPLGGLAYTSGHTSLVNQLKVTLGGPLTHIPLALFFAGLAYLFGADMNLAVFSPSYDGLPFDNFWASVWLIGVKINVFCFLFNLFLPAYPLDCGHVIAEVLLLRGKSPETIAKVLIVLSCLASVFLLFVLSFPILVIWVLFETYRLGSMLKSGQIRSHPVFAQALKLPLKAKPKFSVIVGKKSNRRCPDCSREVNANAVMCGFCEKTLT